MSQKWKKYSKQFKLDALQMYEKGEKSMDQVERELEITAGLLGKWREELQQAKDPGEAFPGIGNLPDSEALSAVGAGECSAEAQHCREQHHASQRQKGRLRLRARCSIKVD
jgi:transposase-like protein